ncbi:MAG TPA: GntR family transcriptional regulator [Ktedonobacteraceae bacterium]|nr:GntR family transcriptional regulator [Ktedonobacteraceae bacterium]
MKIHPTETLPIHVQLVEQLKYNIEANIWLPGKQLPTVRELAKELQINYNTVRSAYQELERQGYITTTQGRGTFVASLSVSLLTNQQETLQDLIDEALLRALALGISPNIFARTAYARAQIFSQPTSDLHLLFTECNEADLAYHAQTIQQQTGITPETYLLADLHQYPADFFARFDLITTVFSHVSELQEIIGPERSVLGLMIKPSYMGVLADLSTLPSETPVGLICATQERAERMQHMLNGLGMRHLRYLAVGMDQPEELVQVFAQSDHLYVSRLGLSKQEGSWPSEKKVHEYATHLDPAALRLLRKRVAQIRANGMSKPPMEEISDEERTR